MSNMAFEATRPLLSFDESDLEHESDLFPPPAPQEQAFNSASRSAYISRNPFYPHVPEADGPYDLQACPSTPPADQSYDIETQGHQLFLSFFNEAERRAKDRRTEDELRAIRSDIEGRNANLLENVKLRRAEQYARIQDRAGTLTLDPSVHDRIPLSSIVPPRNSSQPEQKEEELPKTTGYKIEEYQIGSYDFGEYRSIYDR